MGSAAQNVGFTIDGRRYGMSLSCIDRVLPFSGITSLPGAPAGVIGSIGFAGAAVPVVDPRISLGVPSREPLSSDFIMIVRARAGRIAILVDSVVGVVAPVDDLVQIDDVDAFLGPVSGAAYSPPAKGVGTRPRPAMEPPAEEGHQFVLFALGGETWGVDADLVREVSALRDFTPVPCTPPFILGIASLRGRVVPVLDIRPLLGLPGKLVGGSDKLVILGAGETETVFRVDAVVGERRIARENLRRAGPKGKGGAGTYVAGTTPEGVRVLDAAALMADARLVVNDEPDELPVGHPGTGGVGS
jgi:purine-binding chemotaxis protein CheW